MMAVDKINVAGDDRVQYRSADVNGIRYGSYCPCSQRPRLVSQLGWGWGGCDRIYSGKLPSMLYAMLLLFLILIGIQNDLPARSSRSRESPVDAVVARRVHFLVQSLLGDLVGRRRLDLQSLDGLRMGERNTSGRETNDIPSSRC